MASRFYPQKDIDTFDKFNKELVGDLSSWKRWYNTSTSSYL